MKKKIKQKPLYITGGYIGRWYLEGETDCTSLGGWKSNIKLVENSTAQRERDRDRERVIV